MGELLHIRLDPKMRKAIREVVKEEHYASESGFLRDLIRQNLTANARIRVLRSLQGSVKPFTPRQQAARAKKAANMSSSELFRAFGLDKMPEIRYVSRDDEIRARSTSTAPALPAATTAAPICTT